jgi:sensor histidine kinase YesM
MYLCEDNPNIAKETLEKFSFFLRGAFEAIEQKECVSINHELDIVKNYLYIEKQRFGEKLEVEYDIQSEDFLIPILSIQPVVENAVRHGIRKKVEGGKVIISTFSDKDYHVVKIKDNGIGFDEEAIGHDNNVHVGIKNVKERIKLMTDGTVNIVSSIDIGTEVIIKIPRK